MSKSPRENRDESVIRTLDRAFSRSGVVVRREKLVRGAAFRAKSGNCVVGGRQLLFVDRRLAPDQQLSVLIDYLLQLRVELTPEETRKLPGPVRELLAARHASAEDSSSSKRAPELTPERTPELAPDSISAFV